MPVNEPRNSQGLPLFSQSLEAQSLHQLPPTHNRFFIPQIVLFCLPVLAIGALLVAARPNIAQTNKNASMTKLIGIAQNSDTELVTDNSGRRRLDFYLGGVRGNMFSPPQPPKPIMKKPVVIKVAPPRKAEPLPQVPVVEINPFQDWVYTGVITMSESRMALMENIKTKEGQYVKQGEGFLGGQVGAITDQSITLTLNGKSQTLAKSDTINLTPLSANAPFMQGGGQPGQPQQGQMNTAVSLITGYQSSMARMPNESLVSFTTLSAADQTTINSAVIGAVSESISESVNK